MVGAVHPPRRVALQRLVTAVFDPHLRGPQGHVALRETSQAPPRVAQEALRS